MILSIIIPVFKVEKYVRKTLESIYAQKDYLSDVEVIIVNDGTPDNSMKIVSDYKGKIPNLLIVNQENCGLSCARNTGLSNANGKYVWFVDSDDWVAEHSIEMIKDEVNSRGNIDVFCFKIMKYDEEGNSIGIKFFPYQSTQVLKGTDFFLSEIGCTPMQQYVIRRNFIVDSKLLFAKGIVHEDVEFAPKMLMLTDNVCVIPQISYCYLVRYGDNITGSKTINESRLKSLLYILKEYIELEDEESLSVKHKCVLKVQRTLIYMIYGFSDVSQIKENYLDAFSVNQVRTYKSVIRRNIRNDYQDASKLFYDILFLISPLLYKRFVITRYALRS